MIDFDSTLENLPFAWASECIKQLYQNGVRHIIISPGSRSTPLTMASAVHPQLQKHVILDERSAAFFALGIGKATGLPAALICTSGTAVANYYPAIIEARKSGVPLLALTADRPQNLRNTDANQTINQQQIFGEYPVFYCDVGEPHYSKKRQTYLRQSIEKAFNNTINQLGPAHLNFPFAKPFTPSSEFIGQKIQTYGQTEPEKEMDLKKQKTSFQFDPPILDMLNKSSRPLIIIGQLVAGSSAQPIYDLAEKLTIPVLSEQGVFDKKTAISGFDGFLRCPKNIDHLDPDFILSFGRPPASKSLLIAIERWNPTHHFALLPQAQKETSSLPIDDSLTWSGECFDTGNISSKTADWLELWKSAEKIFQSRKKTAFKEENSLTDGHIYENIASQIPDDFFLFFSNSFAARDRSFFGTFNQQQVFTNRGASGIDGITSTAMGISKASGKAGVLFTGDLAFLHDTNALLNHLKIEKPLVAVVINNQGGSIFRMLPIADQRDYFETYFETPQLVDISKLAKSYSIAIKSIKSISELQSFSLKDWINRNPGFSVIECQTNADASMKLRNKLWDIDLWN